MTPPTYFKDDIDPQVYSFITRKRWKYGDNPPGFVLPALREFFLIDVSNRIGVLRYHFPHLVLRDMRKKARFVLSHSQSDDDAIAVRAIQRVRTQYQRREKDYFLDYPWEWDSEQETLESKTFGSQLGMHPAEFLLSEFLHRNREELSDRIKAGKVALYLSPFRRKDNYKGLVDRFCKKKKVNFRKSTTRGKHTHLEIWSGFPLNPNKKRVQRILEL